ncbi:phage tail sheath family protein [Roseovarius spongiae]|uniref:Phage tail sheath family protein n=1 Tax=Roseovarius spongiae TaxID=2320272 RepID=A0A3A8B9L0_9RHOB|nr:phage tail sheath C-terminal domain-containing protein [Roseovarius spongiae]RKF14893.1 phage tail sheath family protein [Roseovarius spongiae]
MFQPLNPGLHVRHVRNAPPEPARIDVAAFVGIAERGPVGMVEVLEGWPQFVATYGDFQANAYLGFAVRGFFDNGGLRCHVLRVAAPALETQTTGAQPADRTASALAETTGVRAGAVGTLVQSSATQSQGAQPADGKSTVVASLAGMIAGNVAHLQQPGARPARREIVAVDAAAMSIAWSAPIADAFDLTQPISVSSTARDERLVATVAGNTVTWSHPFEDRFDLSKTIHVGFGAAVASGIIYDEAGDPILTVEAADPGRWGNALSLRIATHFSGDYMSRERSTPDPGDRLSIDRVDRLAPGSLVEISQDGATMHRTVLDAVDRADLTVTLADSLVGFDMTGAADGTKPIHMRRRAATLSVREAGRLIETHEDIDLPTPTAATESPVNDRSRLVRIALFPGATDRWIDAQSPLLERGLLMMQGGRDGTANLQPADFTGAAGLMLFDDIAEPAAIAMPDIMLPDLPAREHLPEDPPEPDPCALCPDPANLPPPPGPATLTEASPGFSQASIEGIQRDMVEHCERRGDRVALIDPPLAAGGRCPDLPDLIRWRQQFDSSYAVTYHPWIDVADPFDRAGRIVRRIPPSGHALGQFALADRDPGRAAPANSPLAFTAAAACPIDDALHAILNEHGINAITARPGRGIRIMGARTLSSHPDWVQLTVRRLIIRLKRGFRRALAWAVFEPANATFEQRVIATIEALLEIEWQAGRLRGATPDDAFRVVIDREAATVDNGEFVVLVAVAPTLPAEFVFLRLTFTLDAMDLAELTATGGWPT